MGQIDVINTNGLAAVGARSLQLWQPRLRSAETELEWQRDTHAARMRDLLQSSPYAANALRIHRDNVIGPNFTFACRPSAKLLGLSDEAAKDWGQMVEATFRSVADSVTFDLDAQRMQTFSWLIACAYMGFLQSGETLGVLKWKPGHEGYNTCLLLIEPERLSNPINAPASKILRNGVETDADGAPLAYHIRRAHPSDAFAGAGLEAHQWDRVERSTSWGRPIVLHMYDHTRPDMRRGITALASFIASAKMIDGMDQAELEAAVLRSSYAAVIKTDLNTKDAMSVIGAQRGFGIGAPGGTGKKAAQDAIDYMTGIAPINKESQVMMGGARVAHLLPNESMELLQAGSEGLSYEAFQNAFLRKLAAGAGTTVEQLGRDFSQMTFASAQMSLKEIWRHFVVRRQMIIRQLALPLVGAWLEEAIDQQRLPMPDGKLGNAATFAKVRSAVLAGSTFLSWGPPKVDPLKEAQAAEKNLSLGLTTLEAESQADGHHWEDLVKQRGRENQLLQSVGIPPAHELEQPPPAPTNTPDTAPQAKKR